MEVQKNLDTKPLVVKFSLKPDRQQMVKYSADLEFNCWLRSEYSTAIFCKICRIRQVQFHPQSQQAAGYFSIFKKKKKETKN